MVASIYVAVGERGNCNHYLRAFQTKLKFYLEHGVCSISNRIILRFEKILYCSNNILFLIYQNITFVTTSQDLQTPEIQISTWFIDHSHR